MDSLVKNVFEAIETLCEELMQQGYLTKGQVDVEFTDDKVSLSSVPIIECFLEQVKNALADEHSKVSIKEQIQVKADRKEMNRRISAFMQHKRAEVDALNIQEFCNRLPDDASTDERCARGDAIVVKRIGSKGHIKVSRVVNQFGPQTTLQVKEPTVQNENESNQTQWNAIEERVNNMETHLKIKSGQNISKDVYERLRNLENRILFLEGLSPDYFGTNSFKTQSLVKSQSRATNKRSHESLPVDEIDARISALKKTLKQKRETLKL